MGEGKRVWPFLRVMTKKVEQMVGPTVLTFDPLLILSSQIVHIETCRQWQ